MCAFETIEDFECFDPIQELNLEDCFEEDIDYEQRDKLEESMHLYSNVIIDAYNEPNLKATLAYLKNNLENLLVYMTA